MVNIKDSLFPIIRKTFPNTILETLETVFPSEDNLEYKDKEPFMRHKGLCLGLDLNENYELYLNLEQHPVEEQVDFEYYYMIYCSDEIILESFSPEKLTENSINAIIKVWEEKCENFNKLSLKKRWKFYKENK